MQNEKVVVERRHTKRRPINKGLAFVVMRSGKTEQHGLIIDVSKGGLSCQYPADKEMPVSQTLLDIFYQYKRLLSNIPNTTIDDFVIPMTKSTKMTPMRRRNIQFGNMPANQLSQLEKFLKDEAIP